MTSRGIDFAVLCGYMKLVPANVLRKYKDNIINIHPALLPSFGGKGMYGMNVHKAVIESGVKVSGISVHFVDGEYDRGRIIFQKCCEVTEDDDEYSLEEKIKALEHKYYPEVIRKFEEGKVVLKGQKVFLH
jgi:folate-dependent phosphoribosylglycinamide formyltransferase PurN